MLFYMVTALATLLKPKFSNFLAPRMVGSSFDFCEPFQFEQIFWLNLHIFSRH